MTKVFLTATDRCDRCGLQAYVLVNVPVPGSGDHELLFCAHDFREHESQLRFSGARVLLDQRRQLEKQESHS